MFEYKVVTGSYVIDGAHVKIRNPAGEGVLQQILDHYGGDRWELVTMHLDVTQNVVMVFKRAKVAGEPGSSSMVMPMATQAPGRAAPPPEPMPAPMPGGYGAPAPVPGGYGAPGAPAPMPGYPAPMPGYPAPMPQQPAARPGFPAQAPQQAPTPQPGGRPRRSAADLRRLAGE